MRGGDARTEGLFCYVSCEQRVPQDHPLRRVLPIVDAALADLSGEFAALCAPIGRPSIPPEKLLRALLLQAFDSVRSGASADRAAELQPAVPLVHRPRDRRSGVGRHGVHQEPRAAARRRDRGQVLPGGAQPAAGRGAVVGRALHGRWHADRGVRHLKTFRPKADPGAEPPAGGGRHAERDFHGERRSNATHASTTDPEARLLRKGRGKEAKLCFRGHLLMENRHGLIVDALLSEASGTAERDAALTMLARQTGRHRATLGADKAYDVAAFVADLRALKVTPHVAQNTTNRRSAIDRRTTRHAGYAISQRLRPRIEESFGWIKTVGGLRKTRHRGTARVGWLFTLTATACNLIRLPKLLAAA